MGLPAPVLESVPLEGIVTVMARPPASLERAVTMPP
jgi:hypothetical protein